MESDACADPRIQQTQWWQLHSEPLCVALSNVAILMRCPEIVNNSWGSSKPNAIIPQKVKNMLFLYITQSQVLGSDNRIYFYLHECPGDLWKWHEMPDNSSLCETILAPLPPSQMSALPPRHCNIQKCCHKSPCGRDLRRKKACEYGWRQESKEKDKQWAIPRETLNAILSRFLFYAMLKSPILRPRPLAKLVNQAWRRSAMNNAPNHATELVWWRPCHCHHRARTSQCVQLPPLTWEENTAASQVSPCTAWGPHGDCFFTPLASPLKCGEWIWLAQPLSHVPVLTEREARKVCKHLDLLEWEAGSASSKTRKGFRGWIAYQNDQCPL